MMNDSQDDRMGERGVEKRNRFSEEIPEDAILRAVERLRLRGLKLALAIFHICSNAVPHGSIPFPTAVNYPASSIKSGRDSGTYGAENLGKRECEFRVHDF